MAEADLLTIAEGDPPGGRDEREYRVRRFMELFHGRFNTDESTVILGHVNWELSQAVNFTLSSTAEEIRTIIQEADEDAGEGEWQEVRPRNRRRRREEAIRNENLRQLAIQNKIPAQVRQFACEQCDNMWWRKVPSRKLVSKCFRCRERYDNLPRELEWGWAKFKCRCNYVFHSFGAMGRTLCLCYRCHHFVWPESIIPPKERFEQVRRGGRRFGRRQTDMHSCLAPNCYNRANFHYSQIQIDPNELQDLICVHPNSLNQTVVEGSEVHRSTGSTVDSFLSQDDLDTHDPLGVYRPRERTIDEEDEDDSDDAQ